MREFIFNSEEEKDEFIGAYCPSEFGIHEDCDDELYCLYCWESRANLIVKGDEQ